MKGRRATHGRRLAEAQGGDTPPERLEELAREFVGYAADGRYAPPIRFVDGAERRALGAALAANPNTPPALLAHLAASFPAEFCANPVAPLLVLEDLAFVDRLGRANVPGLLRRADLPGPLAGAIAGNAREPALREEAALHVNVAGEASPETWSDELRDFLRRKVADMRPAGRRVLAERAARGEAPAWMMPEGDAEEGRRRPANAAGPLRSDWQDEIAEARRDPLLFLFARTQPDITGQMAVEFLRADRDDWWRRLAAALNPAMKDEPEILAALCDDGNRFVRAAARANRAGQPGM
jgi:hypothetical protein